MLQFNRIKYISILIIIIDFSYSNTEVNKSFQDPIKSKNTIVDTRKISRKHDLKIEETKNAKQLLTDIKIDFSEFEKAANNGDLLAQYSLGVFYLKGFDIPKDYEKAIYWFESAAKYNHALSQYILARCYQEGIGVEKDHKKAAKLFERASEQGNIMAQRIISEYYQNGIGVEKNSTLADYWLKKSMAE